MKTPSTQKCRGECGKRLPLSEFYQYEDRILKICKKCMKARAKENYYKDPERAKKRNKEWMKRNPEKLRQYRQKNGRNRKNEHLNRALKMSANPDKLLEKRERRKSYALYLRPELFKDQSREDNPFRCHRCGNLYPLEDYPKSGKRRSPLCRECVRTKNREYYHNKKSAA